MRDTIRSLLDTLRFKGMAEALDRILDEAAEQALPLEDVLQRLLLEEHRYRQEQSLAYRITQARLPWDWSLQSFPFERQPGINRSQIKTLAGLDFIARAQNIVLIGPPGTGKTGLAIGLLRQALLNGYRGRFYNAQELVDELYASLADRSTPALLKRLSRYDLLAIDELGYMSLRPEQVNAFFKLLDQRYGKKPTLITTNLSFEDWYELFQRKTLVEALLDRLKHHCITIRIDGPSLRVPDPQPAPKKTTAPKTTTA
jgi:DNA replication protein DnaC